MRKLGKAIRTSVVNQKKPSFGISYKGIRKILHLFSREGFSVGVCICEVKVHRFGLFSAFSDNLVNLGKSALENRAFFALGNFLRCEFVFDNLGNIVRKSERCRNLRNCFARDSVVDSKIYEQFIIVFVGGKLLKLRNIAFLVAPLKVCLLYTSPSPRDS